MRDKTDVNVVSLLNEIILNVGTRSNPSTPPLRDRGDVSDGLAVKSDVVCVDVADVQESITVKVKIRLHGIRRRPVQRQGIVKGITDSSEVGVQLRIRSEA